MFGKHFEKPAFRPAINIGCMLDISTGKYELGKHGEMILNGGLGSLTGIASRPNNFKTALAVYMLAMTRRAMPGASAMIYDTEGTLNPEARFSSLSVAFDELKEIDWHADEQFHFTDLSRYTGDEFFKKFRDVLIEKEKAEKDYLRTTPFLDMNGNKRKCLYPTMGLIDSFSKFNVAAVQEMYAKNAIGSGGLNMDAMANGKAKNQLFNQLPQVCAKSGTYMILTAHVGDIINMELYPTDKRNLSEMKKDTVLKGVSSGFYSLPNNVFDIMSNKVLLNKEKMPVFPLDNATAIQGDTDLRILEVKNLRGKGGITGLVFNLIVSQTEGMLPALSEFYFCKEAGWGIGGNLQNYYVELCPEVKLGRTIVRKRLNEDSKLRRAVEIQSEMLQLIMFQRWTAEQVCDPKTLYDDLKAMGYDWDVILGSTRGYWICDEDAELVEKKYLSTYDLLRMRAGEYKPYWMSDTDKAKITPLAIAKAA